MAVLPLISLLNKGKSVRSYAIIEALILVPLVVIFSAYLFGQTDLSQEIRMSITGLICIPMIGLYGRFVNAEG